LNKIQDGDFTVIVFGPFTNPRDHVEKCAHKVKNQYITHKCEWNSSHVTFWVISA